MALPQEILNKGHIGSMIRITTSIKPKGRKQCTCCSSQHQILKTQERINHDEYCYQIQ